MIFNFLARRRKEGYKTKNSWCQSSKEARRKGTCSRFIVLILVESTQCKETSTKESGSQKSSRPQSINSTELKTERDEGDVEIYTPGYSRVLYNILAFF